MDDSLNLFRKWYIDPIMNMDSNGGFIAMMVALALFERLIVAKLELDSIEGHETDVKLAMAAELGLDEHEQRKFWKIHRIGLLHQGMPKSGPTQWMFHETFGELPVFDTYQGQAVLKTNPRKFANWVFEAYEREPDMITRSQSFPFASVGPVDFSQFASSVQAPDYAPSSQQATGYNMSPSSPNSVHGTLGPW